LATLTGHDGEGIAFAFSPDGQRTASAVLDNNIKVWDATIGKVQATLIGHASMVNAVAFSPSGQRIASASYDKTIKM
jgi:WD40 repeat protein